MDDIGIEIGRVWDNVDDEGWISANNGSYQGKIQTGWEVANQDHLTKIGKALSRFPRKIPSKYSHEIRHKGDFPYFTLRATVDNQGYTILELTMKSSRTNKLLRVEADYPKKVDIFAPTPLLTNSAKSDDVFERESVVSFEVDHSAIQRLGELLLKFSDRHPDTGLLKYHILRWSPNPNNDTLLEFELPNLDEAQQEWERLKQKHPLQGENLKKEPLKPDNNASVQFEFPKQEHPKVEHLQMDLALKEWEHLKRKHPLGGKPKKKKEPWWKSLFRPDGMGPWLPPDIKKE